jgi:hypothetical protein
VCSSRGERTLMGFLDDLGDRGQWSADQGLKVAGLGVKLTARDA